jgi:hypothetical protein
VCTSIPIYFVLSIKKGAPFWRGSSGTLKTYSIRGALLYCVVFSECGKAGIVVPDSARCS